MKRFFITAFLIAFSICIYAQKPYKIIIIPIQFPEIGKGLNPYEISSSIQKILNEKSISNKFQADDNTDDYCESLLLVLHNNSSMFKNKLSIELKNCNNQVIWTGEGMGQSKDYKNGFAEAATSALAGLKEMPKMAEERVNKATKEYQIKEDKPIIISPDEQKQPEAIYIPSNLYYNYTYFTDLVEKGQGMKDLIILNGKLLGYNNNAVKIAALTPSKQENEYAILWENANGEKATGFATLSNRELKIILSDGGQIKTILLQKY